MALPDEIRALFDDTAQAAGRMAESMRSETGKDRPIMLSDLVPVNASIGAVQNAIVMVAEKIAEVDVTSSSGA
jgi:hypothetical protein